MKFLENYNTFGSSNELSIFDFDDTLVRTPDFSNLAIKLLKEGHTIASLLNVCLDEIGANLSDLKHENGRIYVLNDERFQMDNMVRNWVVKGNRLYLTSPSQFSLSDISLPTGLNPEIAEIYKECKNKAIVTARSSRIEDKVRKSLTKFGLEQPNKGLFTYPGNAGTTPRWKSEVISKLIEENNPSTVYFYDDNRKTIKEVDRVIKLKFPDVEIVCVRVGSAIESL